MKDRISTHPNRVTLTPVSGQANTYDLVRADSPTQEGTPLNKSTLLSDTTAAALGLTDTATVNDAISKVNEKIDSKEAFNVGDILATTKRDLSDDWLYCNGSEFSKTDYPNLAAITKGYPIPSGSWDSFTFDSTKFTIVTAIEYAQGYYVVGGWWRESSTSVKARIAYSTDMQNWTYKDIWPSSNSIVFSYVRYVGGKWLAGGESYNGSTHVTQVYYTTDITGDWTRVSICSASGSYPGQSLDVAYLSSDTYCFIQYQPSNNRYVQWFKVSSDLTTNKGGGNTSIPSFTGLEQTKAYCIGASTSNYPGYYSWSGYGGFNSAYGYACDIVFVGNSLCGLYVDCSTSPYPLYLRDVSGNDYKVDDIENNTSYPATKNTLFVINGTYIILYTKAGQLWLAYGSDASNLTKVLLDSSTSYNYLGRAKYSDELGKILAVNGNRDAIISVDVSPFLPTVPDTDIAKHYIKGK